MRSFFRGIMLFCLGMLAGCALMAAAFSLHVVRADDGWHWARNSDSHLSACYADVRDWTGEDWSRHPQLATALVDAGEGDIVIQSTVEGVAESLLNTDEK